MKKLLYMAWLALAVFGFAVSTHAAEVFEIDAVHSSTNFKVGHLGIGYVTGGFTDIAGTITLDKKSPKKCAVEVVVKTASVDTREPKRDDHLRTADFFDAANFPEMSFKSTKVEKLKDGSYRVSGAFTLHGVTKKIIVRGKLVGVGKDMKGNKRAAFESGFKIKRSEYGMTKMIPTAGNEVEITLVFEGVLKK